MAHLKEQDRFRQQAVSELQNAGFIVQNDVRAKTIGTRQILIDVVAWAPTDDGRLVPDVLVEIKSLAGEDYRLEAATHLQFYVSFIGAKRAFVFDGTWHSVSEDFASTRPATCPRPLVGHRDARAPESLVEDFLERTMNRIRRTGRSEDGWQIIIDALTSKSEQLPELDPSLQQLARLPKSRAVVADVLTQMMQEDLARRGPTYGNPVPVGLREALVRLLAPQQGWTVLDPFCGLGTLLTAVQADASGKARESILLGCERSPTVAANARKLLQLAGVNATVHEIDSLLETPPAGANGIITIPPFGVRLPEPHPLSTGGTTREGGILAVDKIGGALADGGRAVVVVLPAFVFAGGPAANFRKALANTLRVVSVIEIATPVFSHTAVHPIILVLEKNRTTDTLVARLEGDWEHQLAEDGDFLKAYRRHAGIS